MTVGNVLTGTRKKLKKSGGRRVFQGAFWFFGYSCLALLFMLSLTLFRTILMDGTWSKKKISTIGVVAPPTLVTLKLLAPSSIVAGDSVTVTVIVTSVETKAAVADMVQMPSAPLITATVPVFAPIPMTAQIFILNTNGTTLLERPIHAGQAHFVLDETMTAVAGEVMLLARLANQRTSRTMTIRPGLPVEPVLTLVGPRSITADGDHWTMVTALPNDAFGNAVIPGTDVTIRTLHPATTLSTGALGAKNLETVTAATGYLLAWARIYSRTKAGRIYIGANAGDAHSPERTILAVPGPPVPFTLHAEPVQLTADGRQLVTIVTEPLFDEYENLLLDGTAVIFIITGADGTNRRLPSQVIDGKATVQLQAPAHPGTIQIEALVLNTISTPMTLSFDAGIGMAPIVIQFLPTDELLTFTAGPLLGPLGQYIPDGSGVAFTFQAEDHDFPLHEVIAHAEAGFASAVIRTSIFNSGRYTVFASVGIGTGQMTFDLPLQP